MNAHQGQARVNGELYMKNRCTILLGISVGNPHYFKKETLEKLLAERNAEKVKYICIKVRTYWNERLV